MERHFKFIIIFILIFSSIFSNAQDAIGLRQKHFNLDNGIALQGYDAVAYLQQKKAIKGNKAYSVIYQGAKYHFTSKENAEAFKKSPDHFEPQYGGWCAYAMGAKGEKVEVDPDTFKIIDGKLFLFYNAYFNNTLKSWNKDELKLKQKADVNWQKTFK